MKADGFAGPIGAGAWVVQQGQCIESIAFTTGLLWTTIWNHPQNADLKRTRGERNILLPGDQLFVPGLEAKSVAAATDIRHNFVRKGAVSRIRIQILEWVQTDGSQPDAAGGTSGDQADNCLRPQPRAQVPYVLTIDALLFTGQTNSDGWIDHLIPPNAKGGKLMLEPGTARAYERPVLLGGLDPIDAATGICQRLANLGFASGANFAGDAPEFQEAVQAFQAANGLPPTGVADEETRAKLKDVHNS